MDPNQPPNYNPNTPPMRNPNPNQFPQSPNQFYYSSQPQFVFGSNVYRPIVESSSQQFGFGGFADYGSSQPHGFSQMLRDDFIPETQPDRTPTTEPEADPDALVRRRGKKKVTQTEPEPIKPGPQPWTPEEELALATAWVNTSEDPIVGNNQKGPDFWKKIRSDFFTTMGRGEYRTNNMLSSKWREINAKVAKFNGIYSEKWQTRRSGVSDDDIYDQACAQFKADLHSNFSLKSCWKMMRRCPKWLRNQSFNEPTSKRSKTSESESPGSSDARVQINLNETDDEEEAEDQPEGLVRPIGRDRAKAERAKARRGSSSQPNPDYNRGIITLAERIGEANLLRARRQRIQDLQFLTTPTDHLPDEDRELFEQEKEEIRKTLSRRN